MLSSNRILAAISAVFISIIIFVGLVSCGNNGPVAPGSDDMAVRPPIDTTDPIGERDPADPPAEQENLGLLTSGEISTETISNASEAVAFLKESRGGVLEIPMNEGEFVLNIWDAQTGGNLFGQVIVVCGDGSPSLWDINGAAMFQDATFPITVSAYVPGYALATYTGTSANVISIPMKRSIETGNAYVFGVANDLGMLRMQFYTDTLIPEIVTEYPSLPNPNFMNYSLMFDTGVVNGFSTFLFGGIQVSDFDEIGTPSASPIFWLTNKFTWNVEPLAEGDHRFYGVNFLEKIPPSATAVGQASVPDDIWHQVNEEAGQWRLLAIPTGIFLSGDRYLALGPHCNVWGENAGALIYRCPWFQPEIAPDRLVISGQLVAPDGSADIVHMEWHATNETPDLNFKGLAGLAVADSSMGGTTSPVFNITNPLGAENDLVTIEATIDQYGPIWDITAPGGMTEIDTSDFEIPLTWLNEIYGNGSATYQLKCIDAISQDINCFTTDQIIMTRRETAITPWVQPSV
jgi:hypothetical protein